MGEQYSWTPQLTEDGSFTFFSEEFGEAFHSRQGAKAEAFLKFAQATDLAQKAKRDRMCLLDVCYGLGYNTAAALESIWAINPNCHVEIYGLELDATVPRAAIVPAFLDLWTPPVQAVLKTIAQQHQYETTELSATLLIGDARQTIQQLCQPNSSQSNSSQSNSSQSNSSQSKFQADAIFFDPFSPRRCPQLWTVEFFQQVAQCLAEDGKLATYSRSASVRSAMLAAGLCIGTIPLGEVHLPHEWSQGTIAAFSATELPALSPMEQEHLQTRAAIPYRDPDLTDTAETIVQRHHQEQQKSTLESTSSWRRRWRIV